MVDGPCLRRLPGAVPAQRFPVAQDVNHPAECVDLDEPSFANSVRFVGVGEDNRHGWILPRVGFRWQGLNPVH